MKGVFRNNIIHFKEVESTNLLALSMMKENRRPLPFVITTDFQTSGKSQGSNKWESEDGKNVLISIAIKTDIRRYNDGLLLLFYYFHLNHPREQDGARVHTDIDSE